MAIGYLQIQARTAQDAVPLKGAQVWVLDAEGNTLDRLVTDESGETQAVSLETVDGIYSQDPAYSGKPYAEYGVIVDAEGFEPVSIEKIPIFDGETAMLPVELVPLVDRRPSQTMEELEVGAPAVAAGRQTEDMELGAEGAQSSARISGCQGTNRKSGAEGVQSSARTSGCQRTDRKSGAEDTRSSAAAVRCQRQQQGQDGDFPQPRVLRQVVIPNPITVHLGAPDEPAPNVQAPFLDYVKNVASSEIYPTWPREALKANVYAIMTFALNRVYTEWYRSRGYDFDITNNTAYDQYYVPGRPIYASISSVADELYGEYIRRRGQSAPYFTSFCNGTTVTCAGLSQWGSVALANQGYAAQQILLYYYPDDIELARTNIVTNALSSYPGAALRVGSSGLDVQTLQTWLGRIRRNYPALPAITDPSGVFGESTRAAVRKFQSIFNLAVDGIVGKATWYKLSSIYTAVTRLAELDSEGTSLGIGTVPPGTVLRQGSRGQDVVTLQYLLNVIAQYYPALPAPAQDGIFGSGTRQAVVAFQRRIGLNPDGIVGARTWQALYDHYLGIEENVPAPGPEEDTIVYVVQAGDTLWGIARRYGTTVEAIRRANGLSGDRILVGQVLRIPVGEE